MIINKQNEIKDHLQNLFNNLLESVVDPDLKTLIKEKAYFAGGCFKAFVLDEKVNDYDLYFKDKKSAEVFQALVKCDGLGKDIKLLLTSENAVTVEFQEKIVQFITRFHGLPFQVIKQFDFNHCKNFYNPTDGYINLEYHLIKNKELTYNNRSPYPISTMKRIAKFAQQGWIISDKELIKIAKNIASYKLDDDKVLKEQIIGLNFSQFNKDEKVTDSEFEERFDEERVVRKVTKKLKGTK